MSINAGQIEGRTFEAQSSSVKTSIVALKASKPALRPCTNGSRMALVNAAIRTLDRLYKLLSAHILNAC